MVRLIKYIVGGVLLFFAGFLVCKFTTSPTVEEKIIVQEKIVYKEKQKQKERTIKKPDGTVIEERINTVTQVETKENTKVEHKIVENKKDWIVGYTYETRNNRSGIQIQKEIGAGIYTGIQTNGDTVILSIGIGF